jgi:carbamoyl-phosphate synthase large subunit
MLRRPLHAPARAFGTITCSVFAQRWHYLGPFTAAVVARRLSWIIEVAPFVELHPLLLRIGETLPALGSLNVLMKDEGDGGAVRVQRTVLGTTAVRAHLASTNRRWRSETTFSARRWAAGDHLRVALRYLEEVFVDGVRADELGTDSPRGKVHPWF